MERWDVKRKEEEIKLKIENYQNLDDDDDSSI